MKNVDKFGISKNFIFLWLVWIDTSNLIKKIHLNVIANTQSLFYKNKVIYPCFPIMLILSDFMYVCVYTYRRFIGREELSCDAVIEEPSTDPLGNSGARISLQSYPKLKQKALSFTLHQTVIGVGLPLVKVRNLGWGSSLCEGNSLGDTRLWITRSWHSGSFGLQRVTEHRFHPLTLWKNFIQPRNNFSNLLGFFYLGNLHEEGQ